MASKATNTRQLEIYLDLEGDRRKYVFLELFGHLNEDGKSYTFDYKGLELGNGVRLSVPKPVPRSGFTVGGLPAEYAANLILTVANTPDSQVSSRL